MNPQPSGDLLHPAEAEGSRQAIVLDLFAGPGGWDVAARSLLGVDALGIESDETTCQTRKSAGLRTIHADVRVADPLLSGVPLRGLIASPPCPEFSSANGKRTGLDSESGALVWEVLRWARLFTPRWIACEQVPQVLPIWRYFATQLEAEGYKTTVGIVDAANYGLPQNRERAVLLAHSSWRPELPTPTHTEHAGSGLFESDLQPWVTLAEALELGPGWVYDSGQMSTLGRGVRERYVRSCDRPAGTLTGQTRSQWVLSNKGGDRRKVTFAEACRLQGFPEDYPFQGKAKERDQQLGNAVPPPLAELLLWSVTNGLLEVAA